MPAILFHIGRFTTKSVLSCGQICMQFCRTTPCLSSGWQTCPQVRLHYNGWKMYRDQKRRECVEKSFPDRMRLNAIRKNTILPRELQEVADQEIAKLPRDSNPIRLVPRCVFTSRPKGIRRPWRMSRIMFRHFADYNKLSGVQRSTR